MSEDGQGFSYTPTCRERFIRALGFRYHLGDEPSGAEQLQGWMRTDVRMRFAFADRLRLLLTGRLHISVITHMDTPSPSRCLSRTDWMVKWSDEP